MTPLPLPSTNELFDLKHFEECLSIFHYLFYVMSYLSYQVYFRSYHVIDASPLLIDTIRIYNNGGFLDPLSFLSYLSYSLLFIFLV